MVPKTQESSTSSYLDVRLGTALRMDKVNPRIRLYASLLFHLTADSAANPRCVDILTVDVPPETGAGGELEGEDVVSYHCCGR